MQMFQSEQKFPCSALYRTAPMQLTVLMR